MTNEELIAWAYDVHANLFNMDEEVSMTFSDNSGLTAHSCEELSDDEFVETLLFWITNEGEEVHPLIEGL